VPLRTPVVEHQFPGPGPQPVAFLARNRRVGARIAALHADRAGWMLGGACRSEDPGLFFPIAAAGPALAQVSSAKAGNAHREIRLATLDQQPGQDRP
jgi:hypothetical protein